MTTSARNILGFPRRPLGMALLWLVATIQCVCFYLSRVTSYIHLAAYEQGLERTPFQYRILLMLPLRWAHGSAFLVRTASGMTALAAWFPRGVRPEGIAEAAIDLACLGVTGLATRALYRRSSRTGLLTPCIYPLTLLMVSSTYSVLTLHTFRFVYDLPGLAFFSLGLYFIYAEWKPAWFMVLFLVATLNRETTVLLLVFFLLAQCSRDSGFDWRRSYAPASVAVVVPLSAAWVGWHVWIAHRFAANPSLAMQRVTLNLGILAIPFAWPQLLGTFCYLFPVVIAGRRYIRDQVLRAWLWALPVWFLFMLYYGVFIEVRLFGELIPYVACLAALIAEEKLLIRMRRPGRKERSRRHKPGTLPHANTSQPQAIPAG